MLERGSTPLGAALRSRASAIARVALCAIVLTLWCDASPRPADAREALGASVSSVDPTLFGARGDGIADDAPAFAKAVDYARAHNDACVTVRPGRYRLATPIFVAGGDCLIGQNGMNARGTVVLLPETVAIQTAKPLEQLDGLFISDMMIEGGENAIDLGLFHHVHISNVILKDYRGWGLSHVRGERHRIIDVTCWHLSVAAKGCLSFGAPENSVNAELYKAANWVELLVGSLDPGIHNRHRNQRHNRQLRDIRRGYIFQYRSLSLDDSFSGPNRRSAP